MQHQYVALDFPTAEKPHTGPPDPENGIPHAVGTAQGKRNSETTANIDYSAEPTAARATLGWRLGLTDAKRTALKITTIGGIDVSKAERMERRKEKRRAADRARRAKRRSGKLRGRPRKNARPADGITIAGRAINVSEAAIAAMPKGGHQEVTSAEVID